MSDLNKYPDWYLETINQTGWVVSPELFKAVVEYLERKNATIS